MFKLRKTEGGRINVHEPEMLTVGTAALEIGTACVLEAGLLKAATGTVKPTHVTLAAGADGATIPAGRITSDQVYETTVGASPTSLKVGQKVTLSTNGTAVTATTEGGIVTIVDLLGATVAGDIINVRF